MRVCVCVCVCMDVTHTHTDAHEHTHTTTDDGTKEMQWREERVESRQRTQSIGDLAGTERKAGTRCGGERMGRQSRGEQTWSGGCGVEENGADACRRCVDPVCKGSGGP